MANTENSEQSAIVSGETDIAKIISAEKVTYARKSPIPSPEDFAGYKKVMPDLPERIIRQFEEDSATIRELKKEAQKADIELQKEAQTADIEFEKRSQWIAFSLILVGLLGTFVLAYLDKDSAAIATGLGTVGIIFKDLFVKNFAPDKKQEK